MTLTSQNLQVVKDICLFIKLNPSLVMVDLSNAGLIDLAISRLIRACRKAIALQTIHLSGNPGLLDESEPNQTVLDRVSKHLDAAVPDTVNTVQPFNR